MGVFLATANVDTTARLRRAVNVARSKARGRINSSIATQRLLFEEIRRTADAIKQRGESAGAERLLKIVG